MLVAYSDLGAKEEIDIRRGEEDEMNQKGEAEQRKVERGSNEREIERVRESHKEKEGED